MNRRLILFAFTAGLGLLAALLVHNALKSKEAKIEALRLSTVRIVVAARAFDPGDTVDAAGLRLTTWPREDVPPGAYTEVQPVVGRVVNQSLGLNQPIVAAALLEPEKTGGVMPLVIPPGMRAMAIPVDDVSDLSGFLLPHARVDVLVSVPMTGAAPSGAVPIGQITKIVLQNIRVLAVAQSLESVPDQPREAKVVTLLVTPAESERLAAASRLGRLSLSMRNYGDQELAATGGVSIPVLLGAAAAVQEQGAPAQAVATVPRLMPRQRREKPVEVIRNGTDHQTVNFLMDGRMRAVVSPAAAADGASGAPQAAPRTE